MPSGTVPFMVFALLLEVVNILTIAGNLGSMAAGNPAVMYLFIVASKVAPFSQMNMVSVGRSLKSVSCHKGLRGLQDGNDAAKNLPRIVAAPPCECRLRHACIRL